MSKKFRERKLKVPANFVDWMSGYCAAFSDFPDGAWQCACENAVDEFNQEHGTHIDTYDGWIYWIEHTMTEGKK